MWRKTLFKTIQTDLASERHRQEPQDPNIHFASKRQGVVDIEEITCEDAHYITLSFPPAFDILPEEYAGAVQTIFVHLEKLLPKKTAKPLLVVGLGNPHMTVDALGQETIKMISATAHLRPNGICLLAPGVTSVSGIETEQLVRATVNTLHPRAVVVIDALCARSPARLGNTIQLSTAGISPGSGLDKSRTSLSTRTLGVPVLAVGVPTLVSTAAILLEAVKDAPLAEPPPQLLELLKEQSFYVCPKDIDSTILRAAALLGDAMNLL